jgi:hypothetical protein
VICLSHTLTHSGRSSVCSFPGTCSTVPAAAGLMYACGGRRVHAQPEGAAKASADQGVEAQAARSSGSDTAATTAAGRERGDAAARELHQRKLRVALREGAISREAFDAAMDAPPSPPRPARGGSTGGAAGAAEQGAVSEKKRPPLSLATNPRSLQLTNTPRVATVLLRRARSWRALTGWK